MIQDPSNRYIHAIMSRYDLNGKDVLEIGCGKGRITRDLAKHACHVVATDPDEVSVGVAQASISFRNIDFMVAVEGMPDLTDSRFDVVMYTLSLHHVPAAEMADSLNKAADLLKSDGVIIVLEPGDKGSFTHAKEQYGAGSGDEGPAKAAAIKAMNSLSGWDMGETHHFYTQFQFDSYDDFFINMIPDFRQQPDDFISEVKTYLYLHRTVNGFVLDAERRLNVLRRRMGTNE
jgi:ubiquinone/menaquinone biosynthesis C-methylase UbiE